MRAVVTGIHGFAARRLVDHLLTQGDDVFGLARDATWPADAPPAWRGRVTLAAWDLADPGGVPADTRRRLAEFAPQVVYHLAAVTVPADCGADDPTPRAWAANVEGSERVGRWCLGLASLPRLLYASTSRVYAPGPPGQQLAEGARLGPVNGYGRSKLAAEERLLALADQAGLDVIVARAFQHAGPGQGPRMMLSAWAEQLAASGGRRVTVRNRNTWVDFADGRDVVRAYRMLTQCAPSGTIVNVATGRPLLNGELLEAMLSAWPERPAVSCETHDERWDPIGDPARLAALIDWRPEIPPRQTALDTLTWWRARRTTPPTAP